MKLRSHCETNSVKSQPDVYKRIEKPRYNTRSQSKINEVNIDFDEASREWNKNKKRLGNGMYAYKKYHDKEKSHTTI
jgi:hypothetical protein